MSDDDGAHTLSDDTKEAWEALFVPSSSSYRDPNRAPTEVAPSTPVPPDKGTPSIPETPRFNPDHGGTPPEEPAIGVATRIDAKDGVTHTPPLLSKLYDAIYIIQGLKRVLSTKWTMESVTHSLQESSWTSLPS